MRTRRFTLRFLGLSDNKFAFNPVDYDLIVDVLGSKKGLKRGGPNRARLSSRQRGLTPSRGVCLGPMPMLRFCYYFCCCFLLLFPADVVVVVLVVLPACSAAALLACLRVVVVVVVCCVGLSALLCCCSCWLCPFWLFFVVVTVVTAVTACVATCRCGNSLRQLTTQHVEASVSGKSVECHLF